MAHSLHTYMPPACLRHRVGWVGFTGGEGGCSHVGERGSVGGTGYHGCLQILSSISGHMAWNWAWACTSRTELANGQCSWQAVWYICTSAAACTGPVTESTAQTRLIAHFNACLFCFILFCNLFMKWPSTRSWIFFKKMYVLLATYKFFAAAVS